MALTDRLTDPAARGRLRTSVIGLSAAVVVALALLQTVNLWSRHRETVSATQSHASDLSLILAQDMRDAIAAVDASLKQLVLYSNRVGGPAAPADAWLPVLRSAIAGMSRVGSLTVVDANGLIRHSTFPAIIGQSRRDDFLFTRLAADSGAGIVADQPFRSLRDNQILIPFGRRLATPEGAFLGVVVATVTLEAFRDFYKSVDVGPGGVIWVMHVTGPVFLREPALADSAQQQTDAHPPALSAAVERTDTGVVVSALEPGGPSYVSAWHALDEPPIVLAVSFSLPEALRSWRRDALLSIGLTVLFALALGGASLQLVRQLDARSAAELELVQRDLELVEAQRVAGLGSARFLLPDLLALPSPQLAVLLELSPDATEMTFDALTKRLDESDRARLRDALSACVTSSDRYQLEVRAKLEGGEERILWSEGVVEKAGDADGTSILAIFQDVTQHRLTEQRSSQSQRLAAIGRFTGGVAHDFNNLLMAIIGYSDMLQTHIDKNNPLNEYVDEIVKAGKRAAELTEQLLAFSRKQVLQPKVLDLNRVVTNIEKMLRRLIGEDIELTTSLSPALGRVKADPSQIEQVLMNLVVNARDAMPRGGKLVIETANVDLDESYARSHASVQVGPFVMLAVSDTGAGMDKDTLLHIFEPFFTTKQSGKGTGLGLSTAYGIVKQSRGNIWAYSEPGKGTTFKVYLPRVEERFETVAAAAPVVESRSGTETILLVEDEEGVRKLARRALEKYGYHMLEAASANEALEIHSQHEGKIHLIVTDVVMPGMSGRELVQRLSSLDRDLRVLYMSGYTDDGIVLNGILDANLPFIQKPCTPEALARKVREVLEAG